jgi:peptidoglycan/xylan/chitin deacetylase (PgdA/CDA1 family)
MGEIMLRSRPAAGFLLIAALALPAALTAAPPQAQPANFATVPILIYHSVREYGPRDSAAARRYITTPSTLEAELKFLKDKGYASIGFDDLAARFDEGRVLPEPCVIISFDDGWDSQYKTAFPLLKKYGFRATFFVFTNAIDKRDFMTLPELRALRDAGMWIGSHTLSHPFLTRIKDPAALRRQIFDSKRILEEKLGQPVTAFAFPFGQYNRAVVSLVREAGYRTARGTSFGIRHSPADRYTLTGLIEVAVASRVDAVLARAALEGEKERPPLVLPGIDRTVNY